MTNEERIKADAWAEAESKCGEDATPYRSGHFYGYIAGATAENESMQGELKEAQGAAKMFCNKHNETATQLAELVGRAHALVDALEWIKTYGPVDELTVRFIDKALEQWKEVGDA